MVLKTEQGGKDDGNIIRNIKFFSEISPEETGDVERLMGADRQKADCPILPAES